MKRDEVDEILLTTLADRRLSRSERKALGAVLVDHKDDRELLAYVRHRAFEVVRRELGSTPQLEALDWLEEVVRTIASVEGPEPPPSLAEAHFSPGDHCRRRIASLCSLARRTIEVCVFTITDDRITRGLLDAHARGVRLRVITDNEKSVDLGSDVERLERAGVPVRLDRTEHHMHHKFAIFDGSYLVSGSYNWTTSAATANEENIVVVSDPRLLAPFAETFERLWRAYGPAEGD